MTNRKRLAAAALLATALGAAGCRVNEHRDGDHKDVNIATPFGGMHVKTDGSAAPSDIGIPIYPGAVLTTKDNDKGSADVNMSFGSFQMRVKAADYRTGDSPDKVEAFYRNGLKRYGDVIACRGNRPVGTPERTSEGLTCDKRHGGHITVDDDSGDGRLELKTGSERHQHDVQMQPDGAGTKFGLVALDLPGEIFSNGSGDDKRQ